MSNYELLISLYDYECPAAECLHFKAGDYLYLYQPDTQQPNWWQVITMKGQLGLIPSNFVCSEKVEQDFYISFLNLATQYLFKKAGKTEDEQEALVKLTCKTQQMTELHNCASEPAERQECRATVVSPNQECGSKPRSFIINEIIAAPCEQVVQAPCGRYEPPVPACQRYNVPPRLPISDCNVPSPPCEQVVQAPCDRYEPPVPACQRYNVPPRLPMSDYNVLSPPCSPPPNIQNYRERLTRDPNECRPVCDKPKPKPQCTKRTPASGDEPLSGCEYGTVVIVTLGLLIGVSGLTLTWVLFYRGGYSWNSWNSEPERHFNRHPTLMIAGFITSSGSAILMFRIFRRCPHFCVKIFHALCHVLAAPSIYYGYSATWESHNINEPPVPHFYSLHSWLGLATIGLFGFQYMFSFIAFLFLMPCYGFTSSFRAALVPFHVAVGMLTFVLAVCCCLTGITESAFFTLRARYIALPGEGVIMNSIGILLLVVLALVVCILMPKTYSRGNCQQRSHGH